MVDPAIQHANDTNSSTPNSSRPDVKKEDNGDRKPSADGKDQATTSGEPSSTTSTAAPSANIHMRCLIVTQDASIIIGKGGSHVNEIREKSGARVMVSESIPGNPERILNVSGPLDAVSKVRTTISFSYLVLIFISGFRPYCTSDKRRTIRRTFGTRQPCCHYQIHDSQLSYGLSDREARLQN